MREDVMASADTAQLEAKSLGEVAQIGKGHVGHRAAREPREELRSSMRSMVNPAWDGTDHRAAA